MAETRATYYSPTQMVMMAKCGEQYRRRYINGDRIPPGVAMMKGTGFHKGASVNMTQKIESHEDLPISDIRDIAVDAFETATHGEYVLSSEEMSIGSTLVIAEAKDKVAEMAELHAEEQAPDYQPIIVEERVEIEIPDSPKNLLGIVDLGTDKNEVIDFKTAGKKKNQDDIDQSLQLTVYAAAFHALTGNPAENLVLDTVVSLKTKTYRQVLESERSESDFATLAERINAMDAAIQAGVFIPAPPDAWWCSDKWCGYYRTCKYTKHGQRELYQLT